MFFVDKNYPKDFAKFVIRDQTNNTNVFFQGRSNGPLIVERRRRKYESYFPNTDSSLLIPEGLA